jgi:glycosyltransferase involved in cell wall biosynthesis
MRCSVVIATKDRAAQLGRALQSLESQRGAPAFEVVVVDNGSRDDTASVVEAHRRRGVLPVVYCYEAVPNRGKARNRGIAAACGQIVAFCDDDVRAPEGWVAAHSHAHRPAGDGAVVVNGPIVNVTSYDAAPRAGIGHYSGAFLCTCNASLPREALQSVGGFDEDFELYGWEDTELGMRLRSAGVRRRFEWDAAIWHVKLPHYDTLDEQARKAVEKARMARRLLEKHPSRRARMATGAHAFNALRARFFIPEPGLALAAGLAADPRVPRWLSALARAHLLDGLYARELARTPAAHPAP